MSTTSHAPFVPTIGQLVRIGSVSEISDSLDNDGCFEDMPFMPEMAKFCGRTFRVVRWATNVCVQGQSIRFGTLENCVILDVPRCDGSGHGGCQMACALFWKTAWLSPAIEEHGVDESNVNEPNDLHSVDQHSVDERQEDDERKTFRFEPPRLVNLTVPPATQYRCQATQLNAAAGDARRFAPTRFVDEHNLNELPVTAMVSDMCSTLIARVRRQQGGITGPCTKTPVVALDLAVGETVRVRRREEIISTLDGFGKNRGLWFDPVMLKYCGQVLTVTRRVSRFIRESDGRMIETTVPNIVLEDLHCDGRVRRYCSRLLHFFWRECWLERT